MSSDGHDRLRRLLGSPDLAWLLDRMRRRLERGEPVTGTVTLTDATPGQRAAVARLLGRRPRAGTALSVRLDDVADTVARSGAHPGGLAAAVVALTGPVTPRATLLAERETAWAVAFARLDPALDRHPALQPWIDSLRATGTVRRLTADPDRATALLADVAAVLTALPAEPEPVGRFAERVLGSAHALDEGRPVTGLVFAAARVLGGVGDGDGAGWRREVWAAVGLLRDELSSTVLALGLPGDAHDPEPVVLTLRRLSRRPPRLDLAGRTLSVCENPVVVAEAADRLGPAAAPLVCVSGQPGAAAITLLRLAVDAGATLRFHGDFDWGGVRIGNVLCARLPVGPWRFDAASYRAALERGPGGPLRGTPAEASWDPLLADAMRRAGSAVEEERVLDDLVGDLAR
ncbi:TIGR02679 family protein [Pseudonocardia sp.]|uniref:TIGR02679 family protein n=1 Tax=Pseudonocardia sp. TaxID=60912 RepID=UPI002635AD91|nr:TIGR02679 family protein [Pseudonocardia sp.]